MTFPARPTDGSKRWFDERETYDQAVEAAITEVQTRTWYVRTLADYPAALTSCKAANGGVIEFGPGDFFLTAPITTDGGGTAITFRGQGQRATKFHLQHATSDAFFFDENDTFITIENLGITSAYLQTRTAGNAIYVNGATDVTIRNIRLGSTYNHITIDNDATRVWINNVQHYREPTGTGTINRGLFVQQATQVHVTRWIGTLSSGFDLGSGKAMFHVDSNVDTVVFVECGDVSGGHGSIANTFLFTNSFGGGGFAPRILRLYNCLAESGPGASGYKIEDATDWSATDCYAVTSGYGYWVAGGKEIRLTGCTAYNNALSGYEIAGGDYVYLDDCMASDNSQATHNTYPGIAITPDSFTYFSVTNCRAGDWYLSLTNKQAYGIMVWGGTADNYHLMNNFAKGNATDQIVDNGTASGTKVVTGNIEA